MAKRKPKVERDIDREYVMASLSYGERYSGVSAGYATNNEDANRVARGIAGTVSRAASINATSLTGLTLRLYRRGRVSGSKAWPGRSLDRKECKALRTRHAAMGAKALHYGANAGDNVEEVIEHPLLDLIRDPDPMYAGSQWFWLQHFFMQVCGSAYIYCADRDGESGPPMSLYPMPPQWTVPIPGPRIIEGYWYGRSDPRIRLESEDVVWLRPRPHPSSIMRGYTWLESITLESDLEMNALQSEIARWANGGQPGLVFTMDGNDKQWEQAKAAMNAETRGVSKSGRTLILRNLKLLSNAVAPKDLQYGEGLSISEKHIYDAAGIPESIYRLNSANLASATVGNGQYMRLTIAPTASAVADQLTEQLLPRCGIEPGEYWFAYDDPCPEDMAAKAATTKILRDAGMPMTGNELRAIDGRESLEGFDVPIAGGVGASVGVPVSGGMNDGGDGTNAPVAIDTAVLGALVTQAASGAMPVDSAIALAALQFPTLDKSTITGIFAPIKATPTKQDAGNPSGGVDPAIDPNAPATDVTDGMNGAQVAAIIQIMASITDGSMPYESGVAVAAAAFPGIPPERLDAIFGPLENFKPAPPPEKDAAAAGDSVPPLPPKPDGKAGVRPCGHMHAKAGDPFTMGTTPVPPVVNKAIDTWHGQLKAWYENTVPSMVNDTLQVSRPSPLALGELAKIIETGSAVMLGHGADIGANRIDLPDATWSVASETAQKYVRERGSELVVTVPDTLDQVLNARIEAGLATGKSTLEIQADLQDTLPELGDYQANRIVRTETAMALVEGQHEQWKESGVWGREWLMGGDPCPMCQAVGDKYAGKPIPWGEEFTIDEWSGEGPPVHPQCTCDTSPVVEDPNGGTES